MPINASSIGITLLKISTVYLLVGLSMGIYMSVAKDYSVASIHTHVNLLGWMTMALSGFVYIRYADQVSSRLAGVHFWGHNIGLPIMMVSLLLLYKGYENAAAFVGVGALLVVFSLLCFTLNVFKSLKAAPVV